MNLFGAKKKPAPVPSAPAPTPSAPAGDAIAKLRDTAETLEGNETSNYELEFETKSKGTRYLLVNATTRRDPDGKTVACADVLVPKIGEIIGGSQREDDLDVLEARCKEVGIDPEHLKWYCELRQYGSVPHAGFGLGFERLVMLVTGVDNIRDVIPFPRTVGQMLH